VQLWVGLGNPGRRYALNRHNIGFMVIDAIAQVHRFGPVQKRFSGWVQEGRIADTKVLLLKPATFMNESGGAVSAALRFYNLPGEALTVFHDELDLEPGRVKLKHGGGSAGHNGLRSIAQHLGADFRRVRIGIGHPGHKDRVAGYVLSNYPRTELDGLSDLLGAIAAEADWLARDDDKRFLNDLALRLNSD